MTNILIINNDFDTLNLMKLWLEKKAYTVRFTENKEEVPFILKEFKPELIIVDVLQKEVLEQLKMNKETALIPVLLMTGYTSRSQDNSLIVDDTIEKPFNLRLLENKINWLIEKSKALNVI